MTSELIVLDNAQRALAEAKTIPELKLARDAATGAKAWVKSRGLGIESENEAAEYILRAERRIGAELLALKGLGQLAGLGDWKTRDPADGRGGENKNLPSKGLLHLSDLGITDKESYKYQLVAMIPDDLFERILAHNKAARERIAKVDFYRAAKNPTQDEQPETPIDKGFDMFRAGVYHMVGWRVDNDGVGGPTKNDLLMFPEDDLRKIAELVKVLVAAYQEAKAARS